MFFTAIFIPAVHPRFYRPCPASRPVLPEASTPDAPSKPCFRAEEFAERAPAADREKGKGKNHSLARSEGSAAFFCTSCRVPPSIFTVREGNLRIIV